MNNPLTQYIQLYEEHRDTIRSHSVGKLNDVRDKALAALRGASLPDKSCEGFEKTSIADMFAPDYGVNITRVNIPVDIAASFRCDVPSLSTMLGLVINDSFHPTSMLESKLPEGVFLVRSSAQPPNFLRSLRNITHQSLRWARHRWHSTPCSRRTV